MTKCSSMYLVFQCDFSYPLHFFLNLFSLSMLKKSKWKCICVMNSLICWEKTSNFSSVVLIRHHLKQLRGGNGLFRYRLQSLVEVSQGRNSSRNLKDWWLFYMELHLRNIAGAIMLQLSSWLDFVLSASFLVLPRTTCPGNGAINSELGPSISNNNQDNLPQTSKCDLRIPSQVTHAMVRW